MPSLRIPPPKRSFIPPDTVFWSRLLQSLPEDVDLLAELPLSEGEPKEIAVGVLRSFIPSLVSSPEALSFMVECPFKLLVVLSSIDLGPLPVSPMLLLFVVPLLFGMLTLQIPCLIQ